MTEIMKNVDILDLVRIFVFRIPHTARFEVQIEAIDKNKNVVFDESSLKVLNEKITERAAQFEARDPRAKTYIEEFVARLVSGLYKNGLVELEEAKEASEDPYAAIRNTPERKQ